MLNSDFKEFAELLNAHGVEVLVVGGYALAAHGHPRYTGDIDFWVSPSPANITRLLTALQAFGFGSLGLKAEDFSDDTVVQLGQPPRRVDLLAASTAWIFRLAGRAAKSSISMASEWPSSAWKTSRPTSAHQGG